MIVNTIASIVKTNERVSLDFILCLQFVMALSNPLHGERKAGFVGMPLPGVQVRGVFPATLERTCNICHTF
jgi:hypothetical protein